MNEDNWQHRSVTMRCGFCIFYVPKGQPKVGLGRCRKHAPTLNGWPAVFTADFCGDHKLDDVALARAISEQEALQASQAAAKAASLRPIQPGGADAKRNEGSQALREAEATGQVNRIGGEDRPVSDRAKPGDGKAA